MEGKRDGKREGDEKEKMRRRTAGGKQSECLSSCELSVSEHIYIHIDMFILASPREWMGRWVLGIGGVGRQSLQSGLQL